MHPDTGGLLHVPGQIDKWIGWRLILDLPVVAALADLVQHRLDVFAGAELIDREIRAGTVIGSLAQRADMDPVALGAMGGGRDRGCTPGAEPGFAAQVRYLHLGVPSLGTLLDGVVHGTRKRFLASRAAGGIAVEHRYRVLAHGFIPETTITGHVQAAIVFVGQLSSVRKIRPPSLDSGPKSIFFQFQVHDPVFLEIGQPLPDDGIPGDGVKLLGIV